MFDSPPWPMDATTQDAELFRRALGTRLPSTGGIVTGGDLYVQAHSSPNMSVKLNAGEVWVPGSSSASQGPYYSRNGAVLTLPIAASDPSNPRVDTIVVQVADLAYAGSAKSCTPVSILGTPTGGVVTPPTTATEAASDGAGTVPASSLVLAYVLVLAGTGAILDANIQNVAQLISGAGRGELVANQSIGSGSATAVTLSRDPGIASGFDAANHRLRAAHSGLYQVNAQVTIAQSGSTANVFTTTVTGSGGQQVTAFLTVSDSSSYSVSLSDVMFCTAGDTLTLKATSSASGATVEGTSGGGDTFLSAYRIT